MIKSMTGFGKATVSCGAKKIVVEVKSLNSKQLDISLKQATYTVTVNTAIGGTASANVTNATPGTEVTLTAQAAQGYHFKEWQVQGDTVTITENKFTMPQGNVTITPVFEAHSYGQPTFAWAEDGKSATATFTCGTCQDEQTVKATITSEVKTEATCTEKGTTTYTATVNFGGKDYTCRTSLPWATAMESPPLPGRRTARAPAPPSPAPPARMSRPWRPPSPLR